MLIVPDDVDKLRFLGEKHEEPRSSGKVRRRGNRPPRDARNNLEETEQWNHAF